MNDREYNRLYEKMLRCQLTAAEQERLESLLARHPEMAELEDELALNQLIEQTPNAPLSSNFTSRVLRAVELEEQRQARQDRSFARFWSLGWVRSSVAGTAILAVTFLTLHVNQQRERAELAASVTRVTEVTTTIPSGEIVEMLKDFDAINRLGQMPTVDYELLAMQ